MNGYERIHVALEGEHTDKIPISLHNFLLAAQEAGYTQREYREDPNKIAESFIRSVEKYKYDGILLDVDTSTLAGAVGVAVDFPVSECARCTNGNIKSLAEVNKLSKPDVLGYKYINIWLEAARKLKEYFKEDISVRGNCDQAPFSLASMMRGTQDWMMDLMDEKNRDQTTILLNYCTEATTQFVRAMAETGVDIISNGDSVAGPAMISPDFYKKFALPYEKKVVESSHSLGLPYVLHICGNTDSILESMADTGTDAVELDYLTDITRIYNTMHESVTFFGNIDPSAVLTHGTPEDVRRSVNKLLEEYGNCNRFVLNSGCAIPATAPSENIMMMIKTAREFR